MDDLGLTDGHTFILSDEWGASLVFELYKDHDNGTERVMIYELNDNPKTSEMIEKYNSGVDITAESFINMAIKMSDISLLEEEDDD